LGRLERSTWFKQCYGSGLVYPGSRFFSISDPGFNKIRGGAKKLVVIPFLPINFLKIENYTKFFLQVQKKLSQLTKNLSILNPKVVSKLSGIWIGSGIRTKTFPLSVSRGKKYRISDPDPQYGF
jgi:hypothetical protein